MTKSHRTKPATKIGAWPWSDDYIREHAYLVERGVRPMAIVDHVEATEDVMRAALSRIELAAIHMQAISFVIDRGDETADCGFAAAKWVVDMYEWLVKATTNGTVPEEHAHRIRGLLLGYSPDAIRAHDDLCNGERF